VLEDKAYPDGTSTAEVAAFHEFGTATIPPRPFVSGYFDANEGPNQKKALRVAQAVIKGMKPEQGMKLLGLEYEGGMKQYIRAGIAPELKSRDGTPLIDTGQLIGSIKSRVLHGQESASEGVSHVTKGVGK